MNGKDDANRTQRENPRKAEDRNSRLRRPCAYCTLLTFLIVLNVIYLVDVQHFLPTKSATRQIRARHHQSRLDKNINGANITRVDTDPQTKVFKNEIEKRDGNDSVIEGTRFQLDDNFMRTSSNASPDANNFSTADTNQNRFSWCVVGNDSMWPGVESWGWRHSVAHVAEALFSCWSYFVASNVTQNCGFYIIHNLQQPHAWGRQLMDTMNCKVKYSNLPQEWNMTTKSILMERDGSVSEWNEITFREGFWFENQRDVELLKQLVLTNHTYNGESLTMRRGQEQILHIGIVNRTGTRRIANLPELQHGIEETLSSNGVEFSLDIQSLEDLTLQQQAAWFASQHVIVAAHGAALTNCIFLQSNATVISLYPLNFYFVGYFERLIHKVGGHNMDWYAGDELTARNVHTEMSTSEREAAKKIASFQVSVDDIANLVLEASKRYIMDAPIKSRKQ